MDKVTCIDVSYWQGNIDFEKVKASGIEAVIIRSGYGRVAWQEDSKFKHNYAKAKEAGLKIGTYWYSYADSVESSVLEAKACLEVLAGKTFDLPVYYDMEESNVAGLGKEVLTNMAETFCEEIKKSGYKPGVYANLNWFRNYLDYGELKSKYSIWLAQYNTENYLDCDIWQNSSEGKIPGISGNCDTNVIYNRDIIDNAESTIKPIAKPVVKKSVEDIAKEVLSGKWGNGVNREHKLTAAGYDYDEVQRKVNALLGIGTKKPVEEIAKEVLNGKWGNGNAREIALTKAGYDYDEVQEKVNELLGSKPKKTVEQIAREVIAGKWGNGEARKDALTKAGYDYYEVQKKVNEYV